MAVRLISSAVGIAIALVVLFFHDTVVLNIAVGLISLCMIYEVLKAGKCDRMHITLLPALLYAFVYQFTVTTKYRFLTTFLFVALVFAGFILQHKVIKFEKVFFTLAVSLMITLSMSTLIIMHEADPINGIMYLVMGLCGAWLADSGAYFVGMFMGRNKLCPEISPKKTVEGFIGGILVTGFLFMLINFIYYKIQEDHYIFVIKVNYFEVCVLGMLLAVVGTLGDLSASVLKRQCGIKDYGNIMPGHGGLMDRFDSVVFTAPFLLAFVSVFNIYYI